MGELFQSLIYHALKSVLLAKLFFTIINAHRNHAKEYDCIPFPSSRIVSSNISVSLRTKSNAKSCYKRISSPGYDFLMIYDSNKYHVHQLKSVTLKTKVLIFYIIEHIDDALFRECLFFIKV